MANMLKGSLVLLGALLTLLSYFFVFPSSGFFPNGIGLQELHAFFTFTRALFTGQLVVGGIIEPLLLALVYLSYWGILLLALMQMGLGVWMLPRCSQRVRTWSIILARYGLALIVLFFMGSLLPVVPTLSSVFLWKIFFSGSRRLWVPALGFLLILLVSYLTRPEEGFPQR